MSISDFTPSATPPLTPETAAPIRPAQQPQLLGTRSCARLSVDTDRRAAERCSAFARTVLGPFLGDHPDPGPLVDNVVAVITELVDVASRTTRRSTIVCVVEFDGSHFMVSVEEIHGRLPHPQDEPGLYLVHRVADEVGQHLGDHGGTVIWASVPV
ncbi:hypothetical protein ACIO3O_37110 [Streptomyces sp. NPDC087440]|uniref:hypothetical protein n=1 Tax=Streptomyces sp. NPDC087440 TaxID=3365790 RepID=UPI00382ECEA0